MSRVKLSPLRIYALKLALYTGGLLYLGIDLFVWQGPLWGMMHNREQEKVATESPVAINVYGEKLTQLQLQRRTAEIASVSGSDVASALAERDLIQNALLRMRTRYNDSRIPDFQQIAQEETDKLFLRSKSEQEWDETLKSQGYTRDSFTRKLAAVLRQQYYLEHTIATQTEVSESEVLSVAGQIADYLVMPECRDVKHIFFATLNKDENTVKNQAEKILEQLRSAPHDFSALAAAHSEDARTAANGGNLGTLYVYPQPALGDLKFFGEGAIPANTPTLVRSKWGWHIVLAGPIQEARPLTEEEYKESVRSAIISYKTGKAVDAWMHANTTEANKKNRIHTYGK